MWFYGVLYDYFITSLLCNLSSLLYFILYYTSFHFKVQSANDWENADLGDKARKEKFLKLMGATKVNKFLCYFGSVLCNSIISIKLLLT